MQEIKIDSTQTQNSTKLSESNQRAFDTTSKRVSKKHSCDVSCDQGVNTVVATPNQPELPVPVDPAFKVISMTFNKYLKQARHIGCLPNKRKASQKVSGKHIKPIISIVNKPLEKHLNPGTVGSLSWDMLSILVFAGATTVSEIGNQRSAAKQARSKEGFRCSYREVESLQKTIGKATAELNRRKKCGSSSYTSAN